jgi:hypothetical protein
MWIRRAPDTGQVWDSLTAAEMAALMNRSAPAQLLGTVWPVRTDDPKVVGLVGEDGKPDPAPFRWEAPAHLPKVEG